MLGPFQQFHSRFLQVSKSRSRYPEDAVDAYGACRPRYGPHRKGKQRKGTKIGVLCSAPHFLTNMLGWGNTFLSQCMRGFIARLMRAVLHSWRWASSPALCQTPSETSETSETERFPRSPQAVCMALVHPSLHGGDTWVDALRKSVSAFCKLLLTRRIKMIKIKMPRPPASGV